MNCFSRPLMLLIVLAARGLLFAEAAGDTELGDSRLSLLHEPTSMDLPALGIDVDAASRSCGRRTLFLWLRLMKYEIDYAEISSSVPVTSDGTSLEQLRAGARRWSDGVQIIKLQSQDLGAVPLPAIAHGWLDGRQATRGHYVVVVRVEPDNVVILDGARGTKLELTRSEFDTFWSGYLMIQHDAKTAWTLRLIAMVCFLSACCAILSLGKRKRMAAMASLFFALAVFGSVGCQGELPLSPTVPSAIGNAPANDIKINAGNILLKTTTTSKHLGVVPIGGEARAVFTLWNASDSTLHAKLGTPSCGCVAAKLSNEFIEPQQTVELELVLSSASRVHAGPREGSVTVGTTDFDTKVVFTASGIVEGLTTVRYTMRLPADLSSYQASPIRGEFALGPGRENAEVEILDVALIDDGDGTFVLGAPVILPFEKLGAYGRRRFEIPVNITGSSRPRTSTYPVRVTYRVDDRGADHAFEVIVLPLAEAPTSAGQSS